MPALSGPGKVADEIIGQTLEKQSNLMANQGLNRQHRDNLSASPWGTSKEL